LYCQEDVFAQEASEHGGYSIEDLVEVQAGDLQDVAPAENQELPGEFGGALKRFFQEAQFVAQLGLRAKSFCMK